MAIDVKQAVGAALQFVQDLFGPTFSDFLLEEAEPTEDGKFWLITVSFSRPVRYTSALGEMFSPKQERSYKVIKVDANSGEAISIKIRSL